MNYNAKQKCIFYLLRKTNKDKCSGETTEIIKNEKLSLREAECLHYGEV